MEITFLGTGAGVPTKSRNVSSVALRLPQRAEVWLFDCGEGTQHQLQRTSLKLGQISRIFITHLHGDHLFGLMGLLATCGLAGAAQEIHLYGPEGLDEYVRVCSRISRTTLADSLRIHTVEAGTIFDDDGFSVSCQPLRHRLQSFGYRVTESDRAGRFDAERAAAIGIPFGPLYGKLKNGESVELADGRVIDGRDLCGPTEPGRVVAYCTDTIYCRNAVSLAERADVLIHEATFAAEDEPLAVQSTHSTTMMAARVASEAGVGQLLLTHISPRYAPESRTTPAALLAEARAVFPQTELARDFMTFEVARRGQRAESQFGSNESGKEI